ncbi:CHAT domain-containing protein [Argonema galeatum]|uniref:CHAT domain-containing protein n=1 Tax=Argonema galeatum TaxID=2942762 RepID=UPI0020126744|nr:CHAT domain-containing protein [Argonema galeatum]MCL1467310.1 CHAT domain-containing protein [Argonema galeatum A003/A1]
MPTIKARRRLSTFIALTLLTLLFVTAILSGSAQELTVIPVSQPGTAITLLEKGKNDYQSGRFTAAVEDLQKAAKEFEALADMANQAQSLYYLSWAYEGLGDYVEAEKAIAQSITILKRLPNLKILAQAFDTQASLQLAQGKAQAALASWSMAEKLYFQTKDEIGVLGSKINQAQALEEEGQYRRSCNILLQALEIDDLMRSLNIQESNCQGLDRVAPDTFERLVEKMQQRFHFPLQAIGLRGLGVALGTIGNLPRSQKILEQSLAIFQQLNLPAQISETLFSLGNTARMLGEIEVALDYYRKAVALKSRTTNKDWLAVTLSAQINQMSLLLEVNALADAQVLIPQILANITNLPPSRDNIYARVYLAHNLIDFVNKQELIQDFNARARKIAVIDNQGIAQLIAEAVQQAKSLGDKKAESHALGTLGQLYEQTQQWSEAQTVTQQALAIALDINAAEITYQWEWQIARLLREQGDIEGAIAYNKQAYNTLQSLRSDLVATNENVQFYFQEQIEPIYRNLVSLLLLYPDNQDNLKQARNVIESLQLAELENFFRIPCLNPKTEQIEKVIKEGDRTAAVIYPIILADRLATILSLPGQPLSTYSTALPQAEVEQTISELRQTMSPAISNQKRLRLSQQVYDWLIRPVEVQLAKNKLETLVFVLDGVFRNVPMAALHDGDRYLIEKYSVALTAGLQLLEPRSLPQIKLQSLIGGLTEARSGFAALPAVKDEVKQISETVYSQVILDEKFTRQALEKQIETHSYPVVHLATHGQFSSKPENTFVLTWDGRIDVYTLSQLLKISEQNSQKPIELLVLSACQTASGDKKAALGLAGLAVRSGVRSTVATLWSVNDRSTTKLMVEFYKNLIQGGKNKAEALRQAQLLLLKQEKYNHPYYWAPFILLGNWL